MIGSSLKARDLTLLSNFRYPTLEACCGRWKDDDGIARYRRDLLPRLQAADLRI